MEKLGQQNSKQPTNTPNQCEKTNQTVQQPKNNTSNNNPTVTTIGGPQDVKILPQVFSAGRSVTEE